MRCWIINVYQFLWRVHRITLRVLWTGKDLRRSLALPEAGPALSSHPAAQDLWGPESPKDRGCTASLPHCLAALPLKGFPPVQSEAIWFPCMPPFPFSLLPCTTLKTLALSVQSTPCWPGKLLLGPPKTCLPRLNQHSSLSPSSQGGCPSAWPPCRPSAGPAPVCGQLSCTRELKLNTEFYLWSNKHRKGGMIPCFPWPCAHWGSPGGCWPSLLPESLLVHAQVAVHQIAFVALGVPCKARLAELWLSWHHHYVPRQWLMVFLL